MSVNEFKANFSEALKLVLAGEEISIIHGKKREVIAKLVPNTPDKKPRRKLGVLEGKGKVIFSKDFKMNEKNFVNA